MGVGDAARAVAVRHLAEVERAIQAHLHRGITDALVGRLRLLHDAARDELIEELPDGEAVILAGDDGDRVPQCQAPMLRLTRFLRTSPNFRGHAAPPVPEGGGGSLSPANTAATMQPL